MGARQGLSTRKDALGREGAQRHDGGAQRGAGGHDEVARGGKRRIVQHARKRVVALFHAVQVDAARVALHVAHGTHVAPEQAMTVQGRTDEHALLVHEQAAAHEQQRHGQQNERGAEGGARQCDVARAVRKVGGERRERAAGDDQPLQARIACEAMAQGVPPSRRGFGHPLAAGPASGLKKPTRTGRIGSIRLILL